MNPKYPSPYKHAAFSQQYTPEFMLKLFALADRMRESPQDFRKALDGKIVALLFYKESTRTRMSFCSAVSRLGGVCLETEQAEAFSSAAKGEKLSHTIRVVSGYADAIVLRHDDDNAHKEALRAIATLRGPEVTFINAGCGSEQHPTQGLADVYTLKRHFGTTENLHATVVGDLARGRACRSFMYSLSWWSTNRFSGVSPHNLRARDDIKNHLRERGCVYTEHEHLEEVMMQTNVIYMTRVQKERPLGGPQWKLESELPYCLTRADADRLHPNTIIMHPLPNAGEIAGDVDGAPNEHYFRQSDNGMWLRMALLYTLLGNPDEKH